MQEQLPEFAIRVHDLVVGFGRQVVIDHLSLDVRRGEILGLVGASGGGKSVLLRTIIGLISPRSGDIEVMGAMIGTWSSSWREPAPQRPCGARPASTTRGDPLKCAVVVALTPLVTPGPAVSTATPG